MPLFRCEKCNCIENTALGFYWSRASDWPEEYQNKKLCSECGPTHYSDGKLTGYGKWHGQFDKKSANGMLIDQNNQLWSQGQIDAGYLPKHYSIIGRVVVESESK